MTVTRVVGIVAAGAVVLAGGCASESTVESARVAAAEGSATASSVVLSLHGVCGQEFELEVHEGEGAVAVDIEVERQDDSCDAVVSWRIDLNAPLGDRELIDGATGGEVPVTAPEES